MSVNLNTEADSLRSFSSSVSFGVVEILEFPIILGDHPDVTEGGPALTMDWEAETYERTTVDATESNRVRSAIGARRRCRNEREALLLNAGFSSKELLIAENEALMTRILRGLDQPLRKVETHQKTSPRTKHRSPLTPKKLFKRIRKLAGRW